MRCSPSSKSLEPATVRGRSHRVVANIKPVGDWLATRIGGRTGKQCRERYFNILNPSVKRGDWTQEEDQIILAQHELFGSRWAEVLFTGYYQAVTFLSDR